MVISKSNITVDESFAIWGSGFVPGEGILLTLIVDGTIEWIVGGGRTVQTTANAAGAFTLSFNQMGDNSNFWGLIENKTPGIRTILATGGEGSRSSVPVMISATAPPSTAVHTSLAVNPVEPGGDTTIWGAGFKPNEKLLLVIPSAIGTNFVGNAQANGSGAFSVVMTIKLDAGIYTLRADGNEGSRASAPLVVAAK